MTNNTDTPAAGPYAQAAVDYRRNGWLDVLPLPAGQKSHPPSGFTGKRFADVSPDNEQIARWILSKADGNIALRMPANVIGIDVDAYGDKPGSESLAAAERRFGPLPDTWRVTSRDDGVSGIRFYRAPENLAWPNQVGPGIETIHRGHRYAVVWPSLHPEGRTYRWIGPGNMDVIGCGPSPDQLPELPAAWVQGLTFGEVAAPATERANADQNELQEALNSWSTPGTPCGLVNRRIYEIDQALRGKSGSRHDAVRDLTLALLRLGQTGHSGVNWALTHTEEEFIDTIGDDRGHNIAELEWQRILLGGVQIVLASIRPTETCHGPDCDGKIPSLTFDLDQFLTPEQLQNAPGSAEDDFQPIYADLSWLLTGERPQIDPPSLVTRSDGTALFYAGRINGVFGDPETAKSWLAMCAIVEALQQGKKAVFLDVDHNGSSEIATRLISLGADVWTVADPEQFKIAEPDDVIGLRQFIQDMLVWQPDVAVIDSLGEIVPMLGLKSTDNDDITKALRAICKPLAHVVGACVIAIDHLPKGQDSRASGYAIGGTAKKRAVDGSYLSAEVILAPAPGKLGKINLSIEKDRNGQLRETSPGKHAGTFVLDSTEPGRTVWRIDMPNLTADGKLRPTLLMERVSRFVQDWTGEEPPARNEILKGVKGKEAAVALAIDILTEERFLAEQRDGSGKTSARRYISTRPYREHQDPTSDSYAQGFAQPESNFGTVTHKPKDSLPPLPPASSRFLPGGSPGDPKTASSPSSPSSLGGGREREEAVDQVKAENSSASSQLSRSCLSCGTSLNMAEALSGANICSGCRIGDQ